jgi:hypothetical protein
MPTDIGTIALFQSTLFDASKPPVPDIESNPAGRELADYFIALLSEKQIATTVPVCGEGGWEWDVRLGTEIYSLFVHWAPLKRPQQDYWVLQLDRRRSFVRVLLQKITPAELVEPIIHVMRNIIESNSTFTNVEWLTLAKYKTIC